MARFVFFFSNTDARKIAVRIRASWKITWYNVGRNLENGQFHWWKRERNENNAHQITYNSVAPESLHIFILLSASLFKSQTIFCAPAGLLAFNGPTFFGTKTWKKGKNERIQVIEYTQRFAFIADAYRKWTTWVFLKVMHLEIPVLRLFNFCTFANVKQLIRRRLYTLLRNDLWFQHQGHILKRMLDKDFTVTGRFCLKILRPSWLAWRSAMCVGYELGSGYQTLFQS